MKDTTIVEYNLASFCSSFQKAVNEGFYVSDKIENYPVYTVYYYANLTKQDIPEIKNVNLMEDTALLKSPDLGALCYMMQEHILAGFEVDDSIENYPREMDQYYVTMKNIRKGKEPTPAEQPVKRGRKAAV